MISSDWAEIEVINLIKDCSGLGIAITGGKSSGVVVKAIHPGGAAEKDGRLRCGDLILQVGNVNVRRMSSDQVASVLRHCGIDISLTVLRARIDPVTLRSSSTRPTFLSNELRIHNDLEICQTNDTHASNASDDHIPDSQASLLQLSRSYSCQNEQNLPLDKPKHIIRTVEVPSCLWKTRDVEWPTDSGISSDSNSEENGSDSRSMPGSKSLSTFDLHEDICCHLVNEGFIDTPSPDYISGILMARSRSELSLSPCHLDINQILTPTDMTIMQQCICLPKWPNFRTLAYSLTTAIRHIYNSHLFNTASAMAYAPLDQNIYLQNLLESSSPEQLETNCSDFSFEHPTCKPGLDNGYHLSDAVNTCRSRPIFTIRSPY